MVDNDNVEDVQNHYCPLGGSCGNGSGFTGIENRAYHVIM